MRARPLPRMICRSPQPAPRQGPANVCCSLVALRGLVTGCSVDPFSKKDWYEVKAPSMFSSRNVGKTLVTRTQGTKVRCTCVIQCLCVYACAASQRYGKIGS